MNDDRYRVVKFINGLEGMGEVVAEDETTITFRKLRGFTYRETGKQEVSLGFERISLPTEDMDLPLYRSSMMFCVPAPDKIKQAYIHATSAIQVARNMPPSSPVAQ